MNEKYNYLEEMVEDIKNYIAENDLPPDREELEERLNEDLWTEDCVTGNASGSYTFNAWKAEEYLCHNLDLLKEACEEFGTTPDLSNPEAMDVTIRCYLLPQAIAIALDEME